MLVTEKVDDSPAEVEADRRRTLVGECIRNMQTKYGWAIPSVVVAELGRDGMPQVTLRRLDPIESFRLAFGQVALQRESRRARFKRDLSVPSAEPSNTMP